MKRACAILFSLVLVVVASSCKKTPEPNPNPNQPTPVVPTKEITIVWDWSAGVGVAPPVDSIRYYTNQDSVKHVYIHLIGEYGIGYPINCTGYAPSTFHLARSKLQPCIDVDSTEVSLLGSLYAHNANAPNHELGQAPGITPYDKDWFERHGMIVLLSYRSK